MYCHLQLALKINFDFIYNYKLGEIVDSDFRSKSNLIERQTIEI